MLYVISTAVWIGDSCLTPRDALMICVAYLILKDIRINKDTPWYDVLEHGPHLQPVDNLTEEDMQEINVLIDRVRTLQF